MRGPPNVNCRSKNGEPRSTKQYQIPPAPIPLVLLRHHSLPPATPDMEVVTSDRPHLIAPRPVRISSGHFTRGHPIRFLSPPSDHFDRLKISQSDGDNLPVGLYSDPSPVSDKDLSSPRSSSCSGLPSEALEEFLSILRPNFFRPTSPSLRARLQSSTVSLPTFPYEHSHSLKGAGRPDLVHTKSEFDTTFTIQDPHVPHIVQLGRESSPDTSEPPSESNTEFDAEIPPMRWRASCHHSSPISRMHTRNPFQRHPSYESSAPQYGHSPLLPSPAAIPLPLPTPDELIEVS